MGLTTAHAFAEAGAAVVLADFKEDAVKAEAQKLAAAGHKVMALRCDASDETQVEHMVEQTVSTFSRLDAAFNNAGVMSPAVETAPEPTIIQPTDAILRLSATCIRGSDLWPSRHRRV